MQKIIAYPLSVIYYLLFGCTLLIFHLIQWLCFNLLGYNAHKKSVDALNFFLKTNTYVLGTRYKVNNLNKIPAGRVPLIIVSNHQSMYDVTTIGWFMRSVHPKYISKIELGKGIPSISYNLRHGGSVLIDRNNSKQSLLTIKDMAQYIEVNKRAVVIFPEGTRSRNGIPGTFAENGLKTLCKYAPSAYIIPVTVNNSWKITRWGAFPLGTGSKIELTIHNPIRVKDSPFTEIFKRTEHEVIKDIDS
jgi:1-acyl-sn-glycerol-3-phosphate acyltransferase